MFENVIKDSVYKLFKLLYNNYRKKSSVIYTNISYGRPELFRRNWILFLSTTITLLVHYSFEF